MNPLPAENNAIKVAVRIRNDGDESNYVKANGNDIMISKNDGTKHNFTYDYVFEKVDQYSVYNQAVYSLTEKFLNEYNVTIFAYGQTGSGKTFTIGSSQTINTLNDKNDGIILRTLNHIFGIISLIDYELSISLLEIHQSTLIDLLNVQNKKLVIQNYSVKDLTKSVVNNLSSSIDLIRKGISSRKVEKTNMNKESSRSHLVLTIYLRNINTEHTCKMNIVDLAGTEKPGAYYKNSSNKSLLIQGASINNSLMQLKMLIQNLAKNITFISYSANNLTKILKDSLGGNSYTLLIACLNSNALCQSESFETLDFANMVKSIKNNPLIIPNSSNKTKNSLINDENIITEINQLRAMKREYEKII